MNVVDCASAYRWVDEVHREDEAILFVKTSAGGCERLMERIESEHPHDEPCVERFEEARVAGPFARWRDDVVALRRGPGIRPPSARATTMAVRAEHLL